MTTRTLLAFVCWQANQVKTQLVPSEYTAVELEEGDLLILDPMLMHSSSQNAVRKKRRKENQQSFSIRLSFFCFSSACLGKSSARS
jgi:hypothetical protein